MDYSETDRIILWLSMGLGVGSRKFFSLMDYYGDVVEIWNNFDAKDTNLDFLSPKIKATLAKTKNMSYVSNCIEKWKFPQFVTIFNNDYPCLLRETADPPILLYCSGRLSAFERCIAVVGTRKCTKYGLECTHSLSKAIAAQGITVVSGGARGIDTKAHEGALEGKGRTICVLGCGIDVTYPPENEGLFYRIVEAGGAIVTEYHPGESPEGWHFPERNRIISGMSSGVLVTEAGKKSGALITASLAAEEGREVFCVPGNITSKVSKGTNSLIKKGAVLVDDIGDIMFQFNWEQDCKSKEAHIDNFDNLSDTEKMIVSIIRKSGSITMDELCEKTQITIAELNSAITVMEISGIIKKQQGNILSV